MGKKTTISQARRKELRLLDYKKLKSLMVIEVRQNLGLKVRILAEFWPTAPSVSVSLLNLLNVNRTVSAIEPGYFLPQRFSLCGAEGI